MAARVARISWNVATLSPEVSEYVDRVHSLIWERLPEGARTSWMGYALGRSINRRARRRLQRERCEYTRFLRLRPQLDVVQRLVSHAAPHSQLRLTVLGCSTGAELYSFLWAMRSVRRDLNIAATGVDLSSSAIEIARLGRYPQGTRELEGLSPEEISVLFEEDNGTMKVRDWIAEGAQWRSANACDPVLRVALGAQDIVVANNFLIHMYPPHDEAALRTIVRLVNPGGYLFVHGVDTDVRARVVRDLGLAPVRYKVEDQYMLMDPQNLPTWPFHWSSREPINKRFRNWETRYASVFRVPNDGDDK